MPGPGLPQRTESIVSAENWHEERDRLVQLLEAIESGKINFWVIPNGSGVTLQTPPTSTPKG